MVWETTWTFVSDEEGLDKLLSEGWEPFGINREDISRPFRIYLKRETGKGRTSAELVADALLEISDKARSVRQDPRVATAILRGVLKDLGLSTEEADALLNRRKALKEGDGL